MFDIHQGIFDEESGEHDPDKVGDYIDGLMEEFAASPEAKPLLDSGEGIGWVPMMLEYALDHIGVTPADMSRGDFEEIVFELFPRKVSTEAENGPAIIDELRAFWRFVQRQYGLTNAVQILAALGPSAGERLRKELADPSNYGMAKSMFMMGKQAGFDMTTQEGLDQFMLAYNSQLLADRLMGNEGLPALPGPEDDWDDGPAPQTGPTPREKHEARREARKRQRKARKRNRRR
jgi:hypothetical protein